MSKLPYRNSRGFSILELMVALAIFLVLSGAVLGSLANLQKEYRSREIRTTMQQRLRATMELMAQEIGQAGLQDSTIEGDDLSPTTPRYKFTSAVAIGDLAGGVAVNSLTGMYEGQWLYVPGGTNSDGTPCVQDTMQIENPPASGKIQANFGCNHPAGAAIYPMGVFPHGILAGTAGDPSTASKLVFYGNINGSANGLFAVEYTCVPANGTTPSTLTRTQWDLSNLGTAPTQNSLIDNWTTCSFTWNTTPDQVTLPTQVPSPKDTVTYGMITQVGFTITVSETASISGSSQTISVTKSYSNIQPRNIIAADAIFNAACTAGTTCTSTELQIDPPAIANPSAYGITW